MADTNELEKAYFAGYFDGEGSVAIYHKKYVVSLTNTHKERLERAKELWGGTVHMYIRPPFQQIYRWQIYGRNSRLFLEDILPYTKDKTEQVKLYLEVIDVLPEKAQGKFGHSEELRNLIVLNSSKLRSLKKGLTI